MDENIQDWITETTETEETTTDIVVAPSTSIDINSNRQSLIDALSEELDGNPFWMMASTLAKIMKSWKKSNLQWELYEADELKLEAAKVIVSLFTKRDGPTTAIQINNGSTNPFAPPPPWKKLQH